MQAFPGDLPFSSSIYSPYVSNARKNSALKNRLRSREESASELLPRVHRVVSLLKRWLMGTHQGAVSHEHLDYYLDEFTFRFNRRTSRSRGKLFYRLLQQAVAVEPVPYSEIVQHARGRQAHNR